MYLYSERSKVSKMFDLMHLLHILRLPLDNAGILRTNTPIIAFLSSVLVQNELPASASEHCCYITHPLSSRFSSSSGVWFCNPV